MEINDKVLVEHADKLIEANQKQGEVLVAMIDHMKVMRNTMEALADDLAAFKDTLE